MAQTKLIVKKALLVLSAYLLGFGLTTSAILNSNEESITSALGQTNVRIIDEGISEDYDYEHGYRSQFKSIKEVVANGFKVQEEEQIEGTVLLKNDNNALPLARGSKVSVLGAASASPFFGASGSGGIDTSEAVGWYDAFRGKYRDSENIKTFAQGEPYFELNETLAKNYSAWMKDQNYAPSSSTIRVQIGDVPWDVIEGSDGGVCIPDYGDAAIMIIKRTGGEGYDLPATSGKSEQYGNVNYASPSTNDGHLGDYLQLNDNEISILEGLKELKKKGEVKKIVLILNMASTIQLDFLQNDLYDIDAAIWAGSVGEVGTVAVSKLLTGEANFSAGMSSTLWMNHLLNPVNNNFTDQNYFFTYPNYADYGFMNPALQNQYQSSMTTYMVYQEGMYLGYKYTETRYEDFVMNTPEAGDFAYDEVVAYPFGYGQSYTTFSMSNLDVSRVNNDYKVSIKIKNTGEVAGKTPVQIYLAKPYGQYAKDNQIQVPSIDLVDFGKTKLLSPNEEQTLEITVREKYFTTYDTFGKGTYVIMSGDYYLIPAFNAHEAVNHLLAAKGYTVANTASRMDEEGDVSLTYKAHYDEIDAETYSHSEKTNKAIGNLFGFADMNTYEGRGNNKINYYSRDHWSSVPLLSRNDDGSLVKNNVKFTMTQQMANELRDQMDCGKVVTEGGEYPKYGAQNGRKLLDYLELSYDNPLWDELLDQLTWEETVDLLSNGRHRTQAIQSIFKPSTGDENGPNGFKQQYKSKNGGTSFYGPTNPYAGRIEDPDIDKGYTTTGFSANCVLAASFNREIAAKVGKQIGEEGYWSGQSGLLGGGFNILRSPYTGRTAEYYSEDAMLTGLIGAPETTAIESMGVHCFVKHCALNESETGRHGVQEWITEQALRENYLRAFEIVFIDGGAWNTMTAFNRFGTIAVASCVEFGRNWLRDEIGLPGIVETDAAGDMTDGAHGEAYISRICDVFTGATDLNEYNYGSYEANNPDYNGSSYTYKSFAPVDKGGPGTYGKLGQQMREAAKRICYAVLHSNAICGMSTSTRIERITPPWKYVLNGSLTGIYCIAGAVVAWVVVDGILILIKKRHA